MQRPRRDTSADKTTGRRGSQQTMSKSGGALADFQLPHAARLLMSPFVPEYGRVALPADMKRRQRRLAVLVLVYGDVHADAPGRFRPGAAVVQPLAREFEIVVEPHRVVFGIAGAALADVAGRRCDNQVEAPLVERVRVQRVAVDERMAAVWVWASVFFDIPMQGLRRFSRQIRFIAG